ncbi:glycosyltransferase family 2 protein [Synechococcus sp. CS-1328]|uniref:glycosyltransferase family 2 protein n=1 Tax=Synechococcus sp. CS-1328 TaxID=2847976 RepID=UPI00223BADA5|nr:glycosyltransferase family 2 protein [Synechococcus sp. CS-1328]MCT0225914.1 glycosyltransferase [Synechococcus sp. CS-1328]
MSEPLVSVVMAVRNGGPSLAATLESVLSQEDVPLEFVVVDDGSCDPTPELLAQHAARDPRLLVITTAPRGLTQALISGCAAAQGQWIARQDAGDLSLPGRLDRQVALLQADPGAVLCSSAARFVVPTRPGAGAGEPPLELFVSRIPEHRLQSGLVGPAHHGSVMFSRAAYRQVGGYRAPFHYAQDMDLWSRLVELGSHRIHPEVLYQAESSPGSISGQHRREQLRFHVLIRRCSAARRLGLPETAWLVKAERLSARCRGGRAGTRRQARGAYFIAACLRGRHPQACRAYLREALRLDPLHLRARLRLLVS